jgi:hypothetical protein
MQTRHNPQRLDPGAIDRVLEGQVLPAPEAEIRRVRETLDFLRTAAPPAVRPEWTQELMAGIDRGNDRTHMAWFRRVPHSAGALAAALLAGFFLWFPSGSPVPQETAPAQYAEARAWLVGTQERDGHWDVARWGGHPSYEVALTALSLIALLEEDTPAPAYREAAQRAANYLIGAQQADGSFGASGTVSAWNNRLAAWALAAYQQFSAPNERAPVQKALHAASTASSSASEWDYLASPTPRTRSAALNIHQIRVQTAAWVAAIQPEKAEQLGGTVYVMARTSMQL